MAITMCSLTKSTRGSGVVEYVLLVGLVALACIGGFQLFGESANAKAEAHARCVATLTCGPGAEAAPGAAGSDESAEPGSTSGTHGDGHVDGDSGTAGRPPKSIPRRVWDFVAGFFKQAWSMIPATIDVITHPIETIEALGYAVAHPIQTYHAVRDAIAEAWNENPEDVAGRITFEVVTLPFIVSKVSKVRAAAALQKALHSRHARTLHNAERVKRIVENGSRAKHGAHAGELSEHGDEHGEEPSAEQEGEQDGTGHREPSPAH